MSIDTSRIELHRDPTREHISGVTNHGHLYFDVPYITEVTPGLWQGGCENGLILPKHISHLLSLYPWEKYTVEHKLRTRHEVRMYDSLDQATDQIDRWARWINARLRTGAVLVHCQAGLNRSGLVTARSLMLRGWTADEAIALLREQRSPAVLCNPSFEAYLRSL